MNPSRLLQSSFVVLLASQASAAVVFQNMTTTTQQVNVLLAQGQSNSLEHGCQVALITGPRAVTRLDFYMRILGAGPATFGMQVRLYRNDGLAGRPGTLLWSSAVLPSVIDSGADLQYGVNVPNVYVPDSFTWTIQLTNRQINMATMGPAEYNPPTIGSAPFGFWRRFGVGPTDWEFVNLNEPPFSARVTAVPIPGDMNCDGVTNLDDVEPFVAALLDPDQFAAESGGCPLVNGDFTGDGNATGADIAGFVTRLLTP